MASTMIRCPFCGFDYPASKGACPWDSTPNRRGSIANNQPREETRDEDGFDEAFDRAAAWVHDLVDEDPLPEELDGDGCRSCKGDDDGDDAGRPRIYELSADGGVETARIHELSADGEADAGKGRTGASNAEDASEHKGRAAKKDSQERQPHKLEDFEAARAQLRQLASGEDVASASGRSPSSTRAASGSSSESPQMRIFRTGGDQEPFLWDTEEEIADAEDWSWMPGVVGDMGGSNDDVTLVCSVKISFRG